MVAEQDIKMGATVTFNDGENGTLEGWVNGEVTTTQEDGYYVPVWATRPGREANTIFVHSSNIKSVA